jgi:hypothetical protein
LITRILATACAALLLSSPPIAQQPAAPRGAVFPVASQMVWIDALVAAIGALWGHAPKPEPKAR